MDAKFGAVKIIIDGIVSIHAPVMDANEIVEKMGVIAGVSIHAPVMDAKSALL